jgi:hypothetical protein
VTTWVRVLSGLVGLALVITVLDAAIRTFLLPRVASVRLSRNIARSLGFVFKALAHRRSTYAARDKIMSLYPSILLLTYQGVWLAMSLVAFALGFVALGAPSFVEAFELSGSSLFTLGTTVGDGGGQLALTYVEAGVGLTLLALLIAFIPTLYSAFQRREISVSRLSVRAGVPSTPWGVLEIAQSVASYVRLDELWQEWEQWFIEVGETHTTLTILNYYRSPVPNQTWIGAAATVLDAAALFNSAVDLPPSPTAGLCIRSGWLSLRGLANYFKIPYPHHPDRTIPIAITRAEFDLVLDHLERSGIPLVSDRDAAWLDFVGWRVNYDAIIEAAYHLFDVPRVDWGLVASQPLFGRSNQRGASGGG